MYGNVANQANKEVYLVDLDFMITSPGPTWIPSLLMGIKHLAQTVVEAEQLSRQQLPVARSAITHILQTLPQQGMYTSGSTMIEDILKGKELTSEEWEERLYSH